MITDGATLDAAVSADLVVVGAGPAGIVVALEVAAAGFDVVLVESGHGRFRQEVQALGDAAIAEPDLHAPPAMCTRRQIGGTSVIWGGRCVPYDPVDFDHRPWITTHGWPVSYDELKAYFQRACDWFVCGRPVFDATQTPHLAPTLTPVLRNEEVMSSALERWSLPTNFGSEYLDRLRHAPRVRLITGLTCTEIVVGTDGSAVDHLVCRTLDRAATEVRGRRYVIACGGLESTRLLLASRDRDGRPIGDHSGHLGRWYMGHVEGVAANVRFRTPPRQTIYRYERDVDGVYVRRRFSFSRKLQHDAELPNVVAWLANPELADARHDDGALSCAYLALRSPLGRRLAPDAQRLSLTGERVPGSPYGGAPQSPITDHAWNVLRHPWQSARFVGGFGAKRFLARRRRAPGFFMYRRDNCYPLQYHGEQVPRRDSRVTLSGDRDALGMPKLHIDLRFSDADIDGVVRAHHRWDEYLRRNQAGELEYLTDDVHAMIGKRLGGGFHQTGTTRMSKRPEDGVVDGELAVHGRPTLHIASSSVFPTSSQANSTFMIVVFSLRLADQLKTTLATSPAANTAVS